MAERLSGVKASVGFASETGPRKNNEDFAGAVFGLELPQPRRDVIAALADGIGGANPQHGSGLRGLADRIDALGGTFSVTSPPGQGTTVHAELPLDGSWLTAGVEW